MNCLPERVGDVLMKNTAAQDHGRRKPEPQAGQIMETYGSGTLLLLLSLVSFLVSFMVWMKRQPSK